MQRYMVEKHVTACTLLLCSNLRGLLQAVAMVLSLNFDVSTYVRMV